MPTPPTSTYDYGSLAVGKPAIGLDRVPGRPLVIVAFASWCAPCQAEMPAVLADYQRFKDRVDFLGVDTLDNPAAGDAMIAKFGIAFPIVRSKPDADAPASAAVAPSQPRVEIRLTGVTPAMLPAVIASLPPSVPAVTRATLTNLAAYCSAHTDAQCIAYSDAHGIALSSPNATPSRPARGSTTTTASLELPHLFLIDGDGIVRSNIAGYTPDVDTIRVELSKIGVR